MTISTDTIKAIGQSDSRERVGDEVVAGNVYDKYHTANPIARRLMAGFTGAIEDLLDWHEGEEILEVGCGEGYLMSHLQSSYAAPRMAGLDISFGIVRTATQQGCPQVPFLQASVYELPWADQSWDIVVMCEVLEHLENPAAALEEVHRVCRRAVLVSVPREPLWSLANMARLKYLRTLGNTPGHVQRWGRRDFATLVGRYFTVEGIASPFPWTMIWGLK
jgi:ubiquinone/menaquinone biosynthesis C-methylase UbiE